MSSIHLTDSQTLGDVWLVKVPKYLANSWKNAPDRAEIGKLDIPANDPYGSIKFTRSQIKSRDGEQTLPTEYNLSMKPLDHQRMLVLSQIDSDKMSFDGNIKNRGELKPNEDRSYMDLKNLSIRNAAKPTRVTRFLEGEVAAYRPRGANQLAHEAELRKRKEEARKTIREDKEIVQGRLFSAFEKQQYYNIKDLVKITNQPMPYLRDILKEICNHCSNGAHKNMWELKPEYRHYRSASGSKVKTEI